MHTSNQNSISLFIAGDLCVQQELTQDYIHPELESFIKKHDFRIVNWEAPIIKPTFKKTKKAGPSLFQHSSYKQILNNNLFNIYNLANNHIMDYGSDGLNNTINTITQYKGKTVGASIDNYNNIYKPLIINQNNFSIAIISCGENQFGCAKSEDTNCGYAWVYSKKIEKIIKDTSEKHDFVIVLPHCGLEMESLPLPEWRERYREFIDLGADIVIASHPHIIQPKEVYKGKVIYYSLGNFLFNNNNENDCWNNSLGISIEILGKEKININEISISFEKNILRKSAKTKLHVLNNNIYDEKYINNINKICENCWHEYYNKYYVFNQKDISLNPRIYKLPSLFRKLINKVINLLTVKPKNNLLLLYHNISIETHRFAVERALLNILNK